MFEESEDDKDRQANELRNLIGKLPSLSIFIDEVHHAVSDEIKLRDRKSTRLNSSHRSQSRMPSSA